MKASTIRIRMPRRYGSGTRWAEGSEAVAMAQCGNPGPARPVRPACPARPAPARPARLALRPPKGEGLVVGGERGWREAADLCDEDPRPCAVPGGRTRRRPAAAVRTVPSGPRGSGGPLVRVCPGLLRKELISSARRRFRRSASASRGTRK
ncbi:hypothetical protein GCM10009549_49850 [Streptomyces thermoalcalitolerans]|uniref:Uncharacterized protein n=1 Tax=Streptomyces thermoalcalitolerans TaxID=65605 RepID=A0ABP3ZX00_9ACTN